MTITLFALLVFTGLGSLMSDRLGANRDRLLLGLGVGLTILVLLYRVGLGGVIEFGMSWPTPVRAATAVLLLAPLGLCLGTFMPLGLRAVSESSEFRQEYVAWAWAVNGFASVVSSVLATMLSMTVGFGNVMLLALALYWVAVAALRRFGSASSPERAAD